MLGDRQRGPGARGTKERKVPARSDHCGQYRCSRRSSGGTDAWLSSHLVSTTSYVPGVLSRAAMEAGSQAFWLLEPGIGARRRVIRSVLVRAGSAANLKETVEAVDPTQTVSDYGEDPATIAAYAQGLGLAYAEKKDQHGRKALECEVDRLPSHTSRAIALETAMKMSAGYRIYSGAARQCARRLDAGRQPRQSVTLRGRPRRRRGQVRSTTVAVFPGVGRSYCQ
jgi:hypothetical protein